MNQIIYVFLGIEKKGLIVVMKKTVLGGILSNKGNNTSNLKKLLNNFKLNINMREIKLKNISNNETCFFNIMDNKKLGVFLDELLIKENIVIHFHVLNPFYLGIVVLLMNLILKI